MTDERNPLDANTESLLRSEALWIDPDPQVEQELMSAITAPSSGRRVGVWLSGVAVATVAVVALLVAQSPDPDWTIQMVAAADFEAHGAIEGFNEPTGTRLVVNLEDVPPAAEGTFYEVWWVRDGAGAVSSGSFLGGESVEMWMGIRRRDFPNVVITLEASDGDPTPGSVVVARSQES